MMSNNREYWNRTSDSYQGVHGRALAEKALAWGVWQIPEADLGVLGDLEGREVLELGCGAAQGSIALSKAGVHTVGIDFSERQLAYAQTAARQAESSVRLVLGDAEMLPFSDESFDVAFCDHGATVFAPPKRTVPEASRVLRPGGVFAFNTSSPIRSICWNAGTDRITSELQLEYFGLSAIDDGNQVCYQLPYGDWIRLFRQCAFDVEELVELRPPEDATTTFRDFVPLAWAQRWPAENVWKLRKRAL